MGATSAVAVAAPPAGTRYPDPERRQNRADRAWDVGVVVAANAVVVVGLWVRHGGLADAAGVGGVLTATGQLTGLVGTYAVLIELLLMSRIAWLERAVGLDRMAVWHRWTGFAAVGLLVTHAVTITAGYAVQNHASVLGQSGDFLLHYPDVLMAVVGLGLLVGIGATSVRAARRRLTREAWYGVHLYAYLAVALSFAHQLAVGTDFSDDRLARAWWIALYFGTFGAIAGWRIGRPVVFNLRHRLRVVDVCQEAQGVTSLSLGGRRLEEIDVEAGQFFLWRFITGTGWAKAHPFSLSAAPDGRHLRITVKDLGDDTNRMQRLRRGVRVWAEGPYGTFTLARRRRRRAVFIAGGIGITPLRAMIETLPPRVGGATLLYRVAADGDIAFGRELAELADRVGMSLEYLVGADIGTDRTDRLGVPALRRLVPDIANRDVFVCGPPPMVEAVLRRLRMLSVPRAQIHCEKFEF